MGWFDDRFSPRATAVETSCAACGRAMWLPRSKVARYKTCGKDCAFGPQKAAVKNRERKCETCGDLFTPRRSQLAVGGGRFCSQRCNTAGRDALAASEDKKIEGIKKARSEGRWTVLRGEQSGGWRGGKEAARERRRPKEREWLRRYRKANPDKVREFTQRRADRKLGRLPYGTLPRIRQLQGNRCAICRCSIAKSSHVDHIVPLALGGKHEATNIQLLCPPCNLAKSSRDPIVHMQSLGRLL